MLGPPMGHLPGVIGEAGRHWYQSKKLTGIGLGFGAFVIYVVANALFSVDGRPIVEYEAYAKFMDFITLAVVGLTTHDMIVRGVTNYKNGQAKETSAGIKEEVAKGEEDKANKVEEKKA